MLTAIRRLPARQREVLVLRFYLDLDEAEIARLDADQPGRQLRAGIIRGSTFTPLNVTVNATSPTDGTW